MKTIVSLTEQLASLVVGLEFSQLPAHTVTQTVRSLTDFVGCALVGVDSASASAIREVTIGDSLSGAATVLGTTLRASAIDAALANGVASHAFDFDDVSLLMCGHPSVAISPAVLAIAEREHLSGQQAIVAYVAGLEVAAKLGRVMNNADHYRRGWHATGTLGTMASTAAAGWLLGLSREEMVMALAIAGSMASGLRVNFGTDAKPLHAGLAARNGVMAAELARRGFTASASGLVAGNGFIATYSTPAAAADANAQEGWDEPEFLTNDIQMKVYPSCASTHAAVDGLREIMELERLTADDIATVDVGVTRPVLEVLPYPEPSTGLEAKFSMEYCVARQLVDGQIVLSQFSDASVAEPHIRAVMGHVRMSLDPDLEASWRVGLPRPSKVVVTTQTGSRHSVVVEYPTGSSQNPPSDAQLRSKFLGQVGGMLGAERAEMGYRQLSNLTDVTDVAGLLRGMTPGSVAG